MEKLPHRVLLLRSATHIDSKDTLSYRQYGFHKKIVHGRFHSKSMVDIVNAEKLEDKTICAFILLDLGNGFDIVQLYKR